MRQTHTESGFGDGGEDAARTTASELARRSISGRAGGGVGRTSS
jgi:hypothetical protein